jgi:lipid-A-disaccharide synthase
MNETSSRPLNLAVVAGEASGDALGAGLVETLQSRGVAVSLSGVGGDKLGQAGLRSLFPHSDIAIMGIAAVLRRVPLLMRRISETAAAVIASRPDLLLTIDSPDFSLRVAKKVRAAAPAIPIVHWVCPSVWAWRPWRARKMKPHVDRIMCLLPFEPEELRKLGGPAGTYVGHPLIERLADLRPRAPADIAARADAQSPEIVVLPGSRRSEATQLLDVFGEAAAVIATRFPHARFVLPAVDHLHSLIADAVRGWPTPIAVVSGEAQKLATFRRARAALAASGTVTLELALAGVPTVAAYRVAQWEAFIARRLIRVPSVLLPNLILGRNVMPELLQEDCAADEIANRLSALVDETSERTQQLAAFAEVETRMRGDGASPSQHVADEIMKFLAERKTPR